MKLKAKQLIESVEKAKHILILGHENPDGDAVGSVLGFWQVLHNMKKNVTAIFPNDAPYFLTWMPNYDKALIFYNNKALVKKEFEQADLIFCLDFNEKKRVGKLEEILAASKVKKILIDHHPYPDKFFDIIISEIEVSSTAELVEQIIENCQWEKYLNFNAAECLFTGILTDTISFTVNASRAATYEIAAKLIHYGLNKEEIHQKVFNSFTEQRMHLIGYAIYKKMKLLPQYSTGYIYLTQEELKKFDFQNGDSEGLVNFPLNIKGIRFAALFLEKKDYIKISFRSIGNIPVNEIISTHFSGGGHKNAAGGEERTLSIDETLKKFERILPLYHVLI
jgi:phosphoesterase RecJ-like protein